MVDEGMLNLIACLSQSVVVIQDASKGILVDTTAFLIGNLKIPNLDQRNTRMIWILNLKFSQSQRIPSTLIGFRIISNTFIDFPPNYVKKILNT